MGKLLTLGLGIGVVLVAVALIFGFITLLSEDAERQPSFTPTAGQTSDVQLQTLQQQLVQEQQARQLALQRLSRVETDLQALQQENDRLQEELDDADSNTNTPIQPNLPTGLDVFNLATLTAGNCRQATTILDDMEENIDDDIEDIEEDLDEERLELQSLQQQLLQARNTTSTSDDERIEDDIEESEDEIEDLEDELDDAEDRQEDIEDQQDRVRSRCRQLERGSL